MTSLWVALGAATFAAAPSLATALDRPAQPVGAVFETVSELPSLDDHEGAAFLSYRAPELPQASFPAAAAASLATADVRPGDISDLLSAAPPIHGVRGRIAAVFERFSAPEGRLLGFAEAGPRADLFAAADDPGERSLAPLREVLAFAATRR
jgi:hypothetical protein